MKEYITALIVHLAETEGVNYVDVNWGQLDLENPPVRYPAVLVSIDDVSYTDLARGSQMAEAILTLTIAQERLSRSSARAKQASRTMAAGIYDTIDAVHAALAYWRPQDVQVQLLTRQSCTRIRQDERGIDTYAVTYRTGWREHIPDAGKTTARIDSVESRGR